MLLLRKFRLCYVLPFCSVKLKISWKQNKKKYAEQSYRIWVQPPSLVILTWLFYLGWLPWCCSGLSFVWATSRLWSEQAGDTSTLWSASNQKNVWLCLKDRTHLRFPKEPATKSLGHCCLAGSTSVDLHPIQYQGHSYWLRPIWGELNGTFSANGIIGVLCREWFWRRPFLES